MKRSSTSVSSYVLHWYQEHSLVLEGPFPLEVKQIKFNAQFIRTKYTTHNIQHYNEQADVLNLQDTSGAEVSQELDHVIGHRGSDGQMGTRRLESVLISNPGGGDGDTFGRGVRVASTGNGSGILGVDLLQFSALIDFDSVLSFEAVSSTDHQ
jgi:hypothetical protein